MPAPVDPDHRRRKIADIASDIISRKGLDAVTIREVAAAAGYSTTIVTHYFANKRALLLCTYQAAALNAQRRTETVLAKDAGDLQGYFEALLPIDAVSLRDWRVYFAFWQLAAIDPEFAEEQTRWMLHARHAIAGVLEARSRTDRALPSAPLTGLAKRLFTLLQGIAVQAVFDPHEWSAEQQRSFLADELRTILQTDRPSKARSE